MKRALWIFGISMFVLLLMVVKSLDNEVVTLSETKDSITLGVYVGMHLRSREPDMILTLDKPLICEPGLHFFLTEAAASPDKYFSEQNWDFYKEKYGVCP